jgi:transmembrane 9 superfamily protein 3
MGGKDHNHYHETLGEALQGMELVDSGYDINFRRASILHLPESSNRPDLLENIRNRTLCTTDALEPKQLELFRYAIFNNYQFQMFVDDLPVWGYVGKVDSKGRDALLYTHNHFNISFNGKQIVEVNLVTTDPVVLPLNDNSAKKIKFSYSVEWTPTEAKFEDRFERYLDSEFFEHKVG